MDKLEVKKDELNISWFNLKKSFGKYSWYAQVIMVLLVILMTPITLTILICSLGVSLVKSFLKWM